MFCEVLSWQEFRIFCGTMINPGLLPWRRRNHDNPWPWSRKKLRIVGSLVTLNIRAHRPIRQWIDRWSCGSEWICRVSFYGHPQLNWSLMYLWRYLTSGFMMVYAFLNHIITIINHAFVRFLTIIKPWFMRMFMPYEPFLLAYEPYFTIMISLNQLKHARAGGFPISWGLAKPCGDVGGCLVACPVVTRHSSKLWSANRKMWWLELEAKNGEMNVLEVEAKKWGNRWWISGNRFLHLYSSLGSKVRAFVCRSGRWK